MVRAALILRVSASANRARRSDLTPIEARVAEDAAAELPDALRSRRDPDRRGLVVRREFDARLEKGNNPGAWTCVVLDDVAELFGTRGLVKIRGAIDGQQFDGALMAQGDGTHRLPVRAELRKAIGKEAGATVRVRIDERIE